MEAGPAYRKHRGLIRAIRQGCGQSTAYSKQGISVANHSDQLTNSADAPADPQHDAHRAIADEWLRSAIDGIKETHLNEDVRREVAKRLF